MIHYIHQPIPANTNRRRISPAGKFWLAYIAGWAAGGYWAVGHLDYLWSLM